MEREREREREEDFLKEEKNTCEKAKARLIYKRSSWG